MQKFYYLLVCALTLLVLDLSAQNTETLWANRVIDVSSSYNQGILFKEGIKHTQYPASRTLGSPDVLPGNFGDSPNAWISQRPDMESSIKVGFEFPIKIQQIAIAESRNPGALSEIYAYDLDGNERLLAELTPSPVNANARVFNVFVNPTDYEVYAVKLVLDGAAVPGYNAIDAIAISSSPVPVDAEIDIAEGLNPNMVSEQLEFESDAAANVINLNTILAPDGNMLFFSKQSDDNVGGIMDAEDIWYLERTGVDGKWGQPQNPGKPLNNRGSNFVSSVSQNDDGYLIVLGNAYQEDGKMTSGVSTSTYRNGNWSSPRPLDIENYYNYAMSANYHISDDQRYLVMSVERDDSRGSRDLYISFNKGSNDWTEPINLGDQVNTPDLESSPYIAEDDSTLYFSSRGYSGFGGEDVYVSYRMDDTWQNWSQPKNLGSVINSARDDTFFNIANDEEFAFLTRGKIDAADLYRIDMPLFKDAELVASGSEYNVKGLVYNVKNNMPVNADIVIQPVDTETNEITGKSQDDGNYQLKLKPGKYKIYAKKEGYSTVEQQSLSVVAGGKNIVFRDLYLIDDYSKTNISNQLTNNRAAIAAEEILFDYNEHKLDTRAYSQLDDVADYMKKNGSTTLQISGHTCDIGSRQFNNTLSNQRANSVASYLEGKGIPSSRLRTQGKGESDPLVPNTTNGNRRINRRVEFKVIN